MEALRPTPAEPPREDAFRARKRRRVRQRVHTPAYASLNGSTNRPALDFSEILNMSEEGMAIQSSAPFDSSHSLHLRLDLSETNASIYTIGNVVWSDQTGRTGIHFCEMPNSTLSQLKEWLFVNAIVGYVNYETLREAASKSVEDAQETASNVYAEVSQETLEPAALPDHTSLLVALSAVKREVEALKFDLDRALQLLADRALAFTRASGAAIALVEGADMVCRASVGANAPSLGVRLKIGQGFSGECVSRRQLLRCEDAETDPLVDSVSCRALGIRSIIAVPVFWEQAVIGLIEVFSPRPRGFRSSDDVVLRQLGDFVASALYRAGAPEKIVLQASAASVDDEFSLETSADLIPPAPMSRKILFGAIAATLLLALYWLMSPWTSPQNAASTRTITAQPANTSTKPAVTIGAETTNDLESLRGLAQQGDAAAQFAVGARYATGEDVPQDYAEAVRWFTMAAEQGHTVAQATLGAYYWAGRGVPIDLVKAYFWSVLAQAGGDEASKYRVAVLASRMNRGQVLAAQQQANDWIKEHQVLSKNPTPSQRQP
jgi:putative methionine-R-sulfoxide reductase with GAF domain